jgi:hypothetical protein
LLRITTGEDGYKLVDQQTWSGEKATDMRCIYENGTFGNQTTLTAIRAKLK